MDEHFARRLRRLRADKDWTVSEASERTGLSRVTIRALEHGENYPKGPTLLKLSEGYGVPISELLGESPKVSAPLVVRVRLRSDFAEFEESLEDLGDSELEELGRALAAEFEEAGNPAKAAEIQAQRVIVVSTLQDRGDRFARVVTHAPTRAGEKGLVEVIYYREPKDPQDREEVDREVERLRRAGHPIEVRRELVVAGV